MSPPRTWHWNRTAGPFMHFAIFVSIASHAAGRVRAAGAPAGDLPSGLNAGRSRPILARTAEQSGPSNGRTRSSTSGKGKRISRARSCLRPRNSRGARRGRRSQSLAPTRADPSAGASANAFLDVARGFRHADARASSRRLCASHAGEVSVFPLIRARTTRRMLSPHSMEEGGDA
jgi:hypothetical protein